MEYTQDRFQAIYEECKNLILKIAYDMTKDYHLAQDICQETFLRLLGYRKDLKEENIRYWLMVVATNLIRDYYRKAYKRRELLDEAEPYSSYDELDYCIDRYMDSLEMHELTNRMLKALHDRNADWYEVFVLVELLEVPRKSVAKERGIALSTVDAHLKKARMWMKEQYGAEYREL